MGSLTGAVVLGDLRVILNLGSKVTWTPVGVASKVGAGQPYSIQALVIFSMPRP